MPIVSRITVRNSLGRRLEAFEPFSPPLVNMYVCGPTVYDYTHIGHARTFTAFDAIKRYLNLRGYSVFHVQNITDIDDKIIKRAWDEGRDWREIVDYYTRDYMDRITELKINIDVHPRVTNHIKEIIEFIEGLIDKGYAYTTPSGSVYFNVDMYPDYGRLSNRLSKELWSQEEDVIAEKRNPYDFALWKAAKPGEPWWDSPWGRGRPGWHIECSVMSSRYAGKRLDIHGGAVDLLFPHHENERAQSEALFGEAPWVKYWLHAGYLTIEGEKMSKSLGNIISLKDAINEWGSETLRLWLLSGHYRSQLEYSEHGLEQAKKLYERLKDAAYTIRRRLEKESYTSYLSEEGLKTLMTLRESLMGWHRDLSNDFNFGGALRWVWSFTNTYYKVIQYSEDRAVLQYAWRVLNDYNRVYAVLDDIITLEAGVPRDISEPLIDLIVEVRSELRKRKMYDLADHIRDQLDALGVKLLDYKDRTEWKLK
ncbi:MAG: cysteine--tRNA ligase [Desulfurococcales archaeon]|nr:cysteine--tRNA ligase [Desulfurococcales archaeon]